jgi:GT2 family glycosyltransferase
LNSDRSPQTSVILDHSSLRFEERHQQDELLEVPCIIGAFMVIRRELWRKLDGMDEGFFFYGEERDFCRRAAQAGAMIAWSPRFRVLHHRAGSTKGFNSRASIEHWASMHYTWRKEMPERKYRFKVRVKMLWLACRVAWYFSLALVTAFSAHAFTGRLRKYRHILKWHWRGCPPGWGLRPVVSSGQPAAIDESNVH